MLDMQDIPCAKNDPARDAKRKICRGEYVATNFGNIESSFGLA